MAAQILEGATGPILPLVARHIQNFSDATSLEPHWGYADRALPCKVDAGSCEYLDIVYGSHDQSMLYTGIIWATVGGMLLIWALVRQATRPSTTILLNPTRERMCEKATSNRDAEAGGAAVVYSPPSMASRLKTSSQSLALRHLGKRNPFPSVFGQASRLQLLVLTILTAYLALWSFLGIRYKSWRTPVTKYPGMYQTRTSLGPWSNRIGVLAFALMPFTIMLASRESLLSLITGIPYQHFNFLHRWLGHIIMLQSSLHTIGWCITMAKLYQPQPSVGREWIKETYMVWGLVAISLLFLLWIAAMPFSIRLTGYEFFRKAHYVLAMVFIGACFGHWKELECFLIPALVVWFLDRAVRLVRTAFLHYHPSDGTDGRAVGALGFSCAKAQARIFGSESDEGDIVRLDFEHPNPASSWSVGQHFYLTFPECSIWQSHPLTPSALPNQQNLRHTYIFRAKGGETKKVAELARDKVGRLGDLDRRGRKIVDERISVILSGAYGQGIVEDSARDEDVLCVAGGTGITYVLPVLLHHVARGTRVLQPHRRFKLVWVVRHRGDLEWVEEELQTLRESGDVDIELFVTRDGQCCGGKSAVPAVVSSECDDKSSAAASGMCMCSSRPDLDSTVRAFVEGSTDTHTGTSAVRVFGSGPSSMLHDLRNSVAHANEPGKAWAGRATTEVRLVCDDRLEG